MTKRVTVVLAGCGVFDGAEIHEASAVLVHLSRKGERVNVCYNMPRQTQRNEMFHFKLFGALKKKIIFHQEILLKWS